MITEARPGSRPAQMEGSARVLENVRIVLVETSHPGNIGASARAMKTMGLSRLVLVRPRCFPHAEATARASGADDVLAAAQVVDDIHTALGDVAVVVGASARRRTLSCPQVSARAGAGRLIAEAGRCQVALVLGRERTGLTNAEVDLCHYLAHIPANPAYGALNLAAAVQVLAYELRQAAMAFVPPSTGSAPAAAQDVARLYEHLETVLREIGFLDAGNPRQLMRRLRILFNRARPDANEVQILRGILAAVQRHGGREPAPPAPAGPVTPAAPRRDGV